MLCCYKSKFWKCGAIFRVWVKEFIVWSWINWENRLLMRVAGRAPSLCSVLCFTPRSVSAWLVADQQVSHPSSSKFGRSSQHRLQTCQPLTSHMIYNLFTESGCWVNCPAAEDNKITVFFICQLSRYALFSAACSNTVYTLISPIVHSFC